MTRMKTAGCGAMLALGNRKLVLPSPVDKIVRIARWWCRQDRRLPQGRTRWQGDRHDGKNRVLPPSVSTADEREAFDRPMSLFEHATRLHERNPTAAFPRGGRPYPDDRPAQPGRAVHRIRTAERDAALRPVLAAFFADPSASIYVLHDDLARLDLCGRTAGCTVDKFPAIDAARVRETGAWLVRHATDRRPAMVGLALLAGTGQPDDVSLIKTIGLLDMFTPLAVTTLATIPGTTPDLIWLAERSKRWARITAIEELRRPSDPLAVAWLLRHAVGSEEMSASLARKVAEAVSLADALEADNVEDRVLDQGGRLLLAMVTPNDYRAQLANYRDAGRAYTALARHLAGAAASMERYAMLVSLIDELRTGYAACLEWTPGQREETLAHLCTTVQREDWRDHPVAALRSEDPLVRRRAEWAQGAIVDASGAADRPSMGQRLQIAVVVPDPGSRGDVQTRILVGGRPVVAAAFEKGPPFPPETLLTCGRLRATAEPREVRLAEAYCTEGCCGALYVTVVLDGDTVVWRDWRGYTSSASPPELRFAAEQYDAELTRAETDRTWEWPARAIARLLRARLAAQPDLLTRWQCTPGSTWARADEPAQVRVSFIYPQQPTLPETQPWLQFQHIIAIDSTPPAEQVAHIVEQMASVDPKTQATVVGGRRDYAQELGYTWPERNR